MCCTYVWYYVLWNHVFIMFAVLFLLLLLYIGPDEMLALRWNSQHGCVFVDGSHFRHELDLGDELKVDGQAPFLRIFDPIVEKRTHHQNGVKTPQWGVSHCMYYITYHQFSPRHSIRHIRPCEIWNAWWWGLSVSVCLLFCFVDFDFVILSFWFWRPHCLIFVYSSYK